MNYPLALFIAKRFIRTKRKSTLVYLISFLSTLGIMLGVAALIIGLSAMNGFQQQLYQRVLSVIPNAQVFSLTGTLTNWQQIAQSLEQQPNIIAAIPYTSFTGLIESGTKIESIQIEGVEPQQEQKNWNLPRFISGDGWQQLTDAPTQSLIIGSGLAKKLDVKVGDWITLLMTAHQTNSLQQVISPKRIRLKIAGLIQLSGDLGYQTGLMNLNTTQQLLNIGQNVSGIAVNVSDVFQVNHIISEALDNLPFNNLQATTWTFDYGYIYQDIQMIRTIMYIAMILVIAVACFNIVSTLMITVKDKQRDIAILRTLGAGDRLIRHIFIYYGLLCGLSGTLMGCLLGIIVSVYLSPIMNVIQNIIGHPLLASDIYFIDFIPSKISMMDVFLVFITSLILSLIASGYPAYKASRINPVAILKAQ